jgi:hypothetical protein
MMGHLILGRSYSEHRAQATTVRTRWVSRMVQAIFRRRG